MTAFFIVVTLAGFLGGWLVFDVYVVVKFGLASGKTISWVILSASRKHIAIPFLTGLLIGLLCGHLFLGMY